MARPMARPMTRPMTRKGIRSTEALAAPEASPLSKSQRKRDAHRSQDLGESLIGLSAADRARLPLWPALEAAIDGAQGLERIARRRQIRYIGRLLREGDGASVAQALEQVRNPGWRERTRHLKLERLQEALIENDEALSELRERGVDIDMQRLRQLILAARRERKAKVSEEEGYKEGVDNEGIDNKGIDNKGIDNRGAGKNERLLFRFLVRCGLDG